MQTVQYPLRWWFIAMAAASVLIAPLAPLVRSWSADKLRLYLAILLVEAIVGGAIIAFATWEWRKARQAAGLWLCRLTPPDRMGLISTFLVTALGVGLFCLLDRVDARTGGRAIGEPSAPIALGVFLILGVFRTWMALLGDEVRSQGLVLGANCHLWPDVDRFEWLLEEPVKVRFYIHGVPFESFVRPADRPEVQAILLERWRQAHASAA